MLFPGGVQARGAAARGVRRTIYLTQFLVMSVLQQLELGPALLCLVYKLQAKLAFQPGKGTLVLILLVLVLSPPWEQRLRLLALTLKLA